MIEYWKVQFKGGRKEIYQKDTKLNLISIDDSLMNHEDMQKIFDQHGKLDRYLNVPPIALACIRKRYQVFNAIKQHKNSLTDASQ